MNSPTDMSNQVGTEHKKRDLGLYIHIPFCVKKCDYCDFLSAPANESTKKRYIEALITEIESYQGKTDPYVVPTIFIGGGTPSSIDASYMVEVLNAIRKVFELGEHLEITIEVNPGTVTTEKLQTYHDAGINRISFGLQSANNEELKLLGRIHTYEEFEENYWMARQIGFHNINVDLMSALPKQTLVSWENTLKTILSLKPEHISAYSLIIEEETPFYHLYSEGAASFHELPDEETDRRIYHRTKGVLEMNGYRRYEISNYAKEGYECRHNRSYWIGTEYLGLGLGASSLFHGARFSNLNDIIKYITLCEGFQQNRTLQNNSKRSELLGKNDLGIRKNFELLSRQDRMEEFMFLGLRMCQGISKKDFADRFHISIEDIYWIQIQKLIDQGLLISEEDRLYLSELGIDISNSVLSEFILDDGIDNGKLS